jgi:hypothetical protein
VSREMVDSLPRTSGLGAIKKTPQVLAKRTVLALAKTVRFESYLDNSSDVTSSKMVCSMAVNGC